MAVVLRNVPPGYHWGWFSREDQRMHLQVVDEQHRRLKYKVWLEAKGRRAFEPEGTIPPKLLKSLKTQVEHWLPTIEAKWVNLMIKQGWLRHAVRGPIVTLIAYANTPNRFERVIDLREYLAPEFAARIQPQDVALNDEFAVVALYATKPETDQPWIQIPPILWS